MLTYSYDAAHDLRSITDNLGNRIAYSYDLKGNRTTDNSHDPDGTLVHTLQTGYDHRNRINSLNSAGSVTQLVQDAVGNLVSSTDPNLNPATTHSYDSLHRLQQTLDALGNPTDYQYDVNDNLVQVKAPNDATTDYLYDDLGNLLEESGADRGSILYSHDPAGNITGRTDARDITAVYRYDARNRRTSIDYPGTEEDIHYSYDSCLNGIGRLCQVEDQSGITQYQYDSYGNITRQIKTGQGKTQEIQYRYDAGDRLISMRYPNGKTVRYHRDAIGQIDSVSLENQGVTALLADAIAYRADGLMTSLSYGNGLLETREYDTSGRLECRQRGDQPQQCYRYDANGNIRNIDQTDNDSSYDYDSLDRLILATQQARQSEYILDSNGNRDERLVDGASENYTAAQDGNRILDITDDSSTRIYSYDASGNIIGDGHSQYSYGASNRLNEVTRNGTAIALYTYNGFGQRSKKQTNGIITHYLYDLDGKLIAETDASGNIQKSYYYLNGQPLALSITDDSNNDGNATPNSPPILTHIDSQSGMLGEAISLSLIASDADADTLSYSARALPEGLSINAISGEISGSLDAEGSFQVTLIVDDSRGGSDSVTISWTVTDSGTANTLVAGFQADYSEGTPATGWHYLWNANGPLGQASNYVDLAWNGSFYDSDGIAGHPDTTALAYGNISDIGGHPGDGTLNGESVDRAVIVAYDISQAGDYQITTSQLTSNGCQWGNGGQLSVFVNDAQISSQTYVQDASLNFDRPLGALDSNDTVYIAISPKGDAGCDGFIWDFALEITPPSNQAPSIISLGTLNHALGDLIALQINASDLENDVLDYVAWGLPAGLSINTSSGQISGTTNTAGNYQSTIVADDGNGNSVAETFAWVITAGTGTVSTVATYQADYSGGTPTAGWRYLWNASGPVGQASGYTDLAWNGSFYDSDGIAGIPDATAFAYGNLGGTGGHPGQGTELGESNDRAVIIAYDISQTGNYQIAASQLSSIGCQWGTGGQVSVFVNDTQISSQTYALGSTINFDGSLGSLENSDTVYVAIGPDGDDGCDEFNLDFALTVGSGNQQRADTYFIHTDHLGTPVALTDIDQNIAWSADYAPFGRADVTAETVVFNLRFPGQYFDSETGLHYNYQRYYDPGTGRYITSDPIGLQGGINTYGYVNQNPLKFIDPLGLEASQSAYPRYPGPLDILIPGSPTNDAFVDKTTGMLSDISDILDEIIDDLDKKNTPTLDGDPAVDDPGGSGNSQRAKYCRGKCSKILEIGGSTSEFDFRNCLRNCMQDPDACI